jgi:hypothetical protein
LQVLTNHVSTKGENVQWLWRTPCLGTAMHYVNGYVKCFMHIQCIL